MFILGIATSTLVYLGLRIGELCGKHTRQKFHKCPLTDTFLQSESPVSQWRLICQVIVTKCVSTGDEICLRSSDPGFVSMGRGNNEFFTEEEDLELTILPKKSQARFTPDAGILLLKLCGSPLLLAVSLLWLGILWICFCIIAGA